jgi:hypothetical protein
MELGTRRLGDIGARDVAVSELEARLKEALGEGAELLREVHLEHEAESRTAAFDLVVRSGREVAVVGVAWSTRQGDVTKLALSSLLAVADAFGEYVQPVFITRLDDRVRDVVERSLARRAAGARLARVLGRSTLETTDILEAMGISAAQAVR